MNTVMLILKVILWFSNEAVHTVHFLFTGRKITRIQSKDVPLIKGDRFFILNDIKTEPGRVLNPKYIIVFPNWVHD